MKSKLNIRHKRFLIWLLYCISKYSSREHGSCKRVCFKHGSLKLGAHKRRFFAQNSREARFTRTRFARARIFQTRPAQARSQTRLAQARVPQTKLPRKRSSRGISLSQSNTWRAHLLAKCTLIQLVIGMKPTFRRTSIKTLARVNHKRIHFFFAQQGFQRVC